MAIIDMSKFSLFSFEKDREKLLDELQKFEYVHFSDTSGLSQEKGLKNIKLPVELEENQNELDQLDFMITTLSKRKEEKSSLQAMKEGLKSYSLQELKEKAKDLDFSSDFANLREIQMKIEELKQAVLDKKSRIEELKPWVSLDTRIEDLSDSDRVKILTGSLPMNKVENVRMKLSELKYSYIQEVSNVKSSVYVLAIIHRKDYKKAIEVLRMNGFNSLKVPGKDTALEEIKILESAILDLEGKKNELDGNINQFSSKLESMELRYEYLMNQKLKLSSTERFMELSDVNIVVGYIPKNKKDDFEKLLASILENRYYVEFSEVARDSEEVPILLSNNSFIKPFESITDMYALPKYNEIDPTPIFAIFYWIFFGMMVADFGYGVLMVLGTLAALKFFNLPEAKKNFIKFFLFLGVSTSIWGLIFGSIFGQPLPFGLLNPSEEPIKLLGLSMAMGGVHLFFGLGIKAYMLFRDGKPMDAIFDVILWYMAVIGVIVMLISSSTSIIPPLVASIFKWIMIVGMVGIVIFAARDTQNKAARLAGGLYSLYGISSWIGDFVSYSRLMALGLSGGFIAFALNLIIDMLPKGIIGIVIGGIIFIGGHLFNAFLSYLSAYVHTARLTYVEFFGKFYEGGGLPFNKFKSETKYINIK